MKCNLLLLFILSALGVYAQTAPLRAHEAGLQSDNDSYLAQGSDRYYTNGIFVFYRQALTINTNTETHLANKVLGFEAGQKMFNPQTGAIPAKRYVDRPFAGYLYAGSTLNLLYKNESNLKLGLQAGVVGPAALGEEAQNVIHDTFGFYELEGWQYQIRNNLQLNLSAEYNKLLARVSGFDVSASAYANLGTGFTGAGVGPLLRAGYFNQLFNSVSTQSTATKNQEFTPLHKNEFFAYYKPMLNYVGYDVTIQGGLFADADPSGNEITLIPKRAVFSNEIGVSYAGSRWILGAAAVFRTKEVKEVLRAHQWGSVTALYRFK